MALKLAVLGATGRMGAAVLRLAQADDALEIAAALAAPDDPQLGVDAGDLAGGRALGLPVASATDAEFDVLIDFSAPAAVARWAEECATRGAALVSGTTGMTPEQTAALQAAAERVPVVWAPNMSIGVNVLLRAVRDVARLLGDGWDIEIAEAHHRHKVDAPSGTARALYETVCDALGRDPAAVGVFGREGEVGARTANEIGVHALRMGSVVGEHAVHYASDQEIITLSHSAKTRDVFAAGALRAAKWTQGRPAGYYGMRDVLFAD